jgi:hypothetical protein
MPLEKPSARRLTPLWVISIFVSLTEVVLSVAATRVTGGVQVALVAFVIVFPTLIAGAFFACLWWKPWVFYPPAEYGRSTTVQQYVDALQGKPPSVVRETKDVKEPVTVVGNPDDMRLLFKAAAATWERSTKAMDVGHGCIVQVSTKIRVPDGGWNVAEALAYVPDVTIVDSRADGRTLRARAISESTAR